MQEERIKTLRALIEKEPNDPFNHYGLALELVKTDPEEALSLFNYVFIKHEDYLPNYYQLGKLLEDMDDEERALDIYLAGIEVAQIQDDQKAIDELGKAHKSLEDQMLL